MTTPRRPEHAPKKPSLFSRFKAGLKRVIGGDKKKEAAHAPAKEPGHSKEHHPATIHAHKRTHDDKPREHAPRQPREHSAR
ncbi:MAG: hypothetical protein WAW39_18385, partial [Prosthecobacter sp.]|uniref:hypothetical protein n=1 Tax=Prosthecobacter sp. TaxID=1965333 RepID=UPI003BAEEA95